MLLIQLLYFESIKNLQWCPGCNKFVIWMIVRLRWQYDEFATINKRDFHQSYFACKFIFLLSFPSFFVNITILISASLPTLLSESFLRISPTTSCLSQFLNLTQPDNLLVMVWIPHKVQQTDYKRYFWWI